MVDDSVAVAAEEGFHVVEVAVASVEVVGIVTLLPEYGRRGVHVVVAGTFDDALSGAGRQREGNGFESRTVRLPVAKHCSKAIPIL